MESSNAASAATAAEAAEVVEDAAMFGVLDIFVLVAVVALGAWWLWRNMRPAPPPPPPSTYLQSPSMFTSQTSMDTSFIKKLRSSGRSLVVFYGSQTGTAEEFAGRLAKEGMRYQLKGMVADPEECEMEELGSLKEISNSLAVFCVATYGEGDPTDNAQEFYEWLQNGDADLTGLNYAVFGLGNKTYEHYNAMAKYVDKRLEELGATRVFELGMGDDDANIEDDFITWKDRFWPAVCEYFGIEATGEDVSVRQYRLTVHEDKSPEKVYTGEVARIHSLTNQRPPYDAKNPYLAPIIVNRELHKSGSRSCMHIELNIEGSKIRYDAGDHVAVYPINDEQLVNRIGELLGIDLETVITLTNTDEDSTKKHPFPCPCSYRTALLHYVDITSNPRTHILKELVEYTTDEKEKEQLRMMASTSAEGKQLYTDWVIHANRNIVHILEDLLSCKPALDHLCELLPRLQARYYSISSSSKLYPMTIHVTAVLVQYETPTNRINKGVATSWLAKKIPNAEVFPTVPIFVRRSQFRLPTRPQTPVLMIGPGTGVAPFRGFIQERDQAKSDGKTVGDTILYFGCRKKAEDFIYEEELEEYVKRGVLKMYTAFSRDQEHKVYVTHLLRQNADEVWRIIGQENGHLYVCGDAKNMARDVHDIVMHVVQEKGGLSSDAANAYVKKMEAQKRYSADVWS